MLSDEAITQVARVSQEQRSGAREDVRWVMPPLTLGRAASAAVTATHGLKVGHRLGEHVIAERRGYDGVCELYVVSHGERGSLHLARVLRREHVGLAPALLEAARRIEHDPHRNLLTILATGWTDEPTPRAYVVHERVVGRSLASLLAGRGGVEWPLVLAIGLQCAEALAALHRIGLAHTALKPDSAALVHVAGDQFRVVVGGLDHTQAICPGASATEDPRVGDDLFALGSMLAALAASSAASGSRVPEMLACMVARMIDPRPAIRPASAEELHDQLSAVHEHVDPDLSGMRMLGEAFRGTVSDDFEVDVEVDEGEEPPAPPPVAHAPVTGPLLIVRRPPVRWPGLLLGGLLCFGAGAVARDLQRGDMPAPHAQHGVDDDEPGAPDVAVHRVPGPHAVSSPMTAPPPGQRAMELPLTVLPRCDDRTARGPSRTLVARATREPTAEPEPPAAEEETAPEAPAADDEVVEPVEPDTDLLPIPRHATAVIPDLEATP